MPVGANASALFCHWLLVSLAATFSRPAWRLRRRETIGSNGPTFRDSLPLVAARQRLATGEAIGLAGWPEPAHGHAPSARSLFSAAGRRLLAPLRLLSRSWRGRLFRRGSRCCSLDRLLLLLLLVLSRRLRLGLLLRLVRLVVLSLAPLLTTTLTLLAPWRTGRTRRTALTPLLALAFAARRTLTALTLRLSLGLLTSLSLALTALTPGSCLSMLRTRTPATLLRPLTSLGSLASLRRAPLSNADLARQQSRLRRSFLPLGTWAFAGEHVPFVDPDFDPNHAIGCVSLCLPIVDIGAQGMQGDFPLNLLLTACNLRAAKAPTDNDLDPLGIGAHRFLHRLLHGAPE